MPDGSGECGGYARHLWFAGKGRFGGPFFLASTLLKHCPDASEKAGNAGEASFHPLRS
jgi:hypothetical protein